jgi:tetratricopeptide (TPR) repeat protein
MFTGNTMSLARNKHLTAVAAFLWLFYTVDVLADACPYCGRQYGAAAPGDSARVAALRAAHEASCPSRSRMPSGGSNNTPQYVPTPQERAEARAYQQACELNRKGNEAWKAGKLAEAVGFYRQAVSLDPYGDNTIRENLRKCSGSWENEQGNTAMGKQDYATAVTHYRQAMRLKPESEVIKKNLAEAEAMLSQQMAQLAEAAAEQKRDAESISRLREQLKNFSQILNNPSAKAVDFDGTGKGAPSSTGGGLGFMSLSGSVPTAKKPGAPPSSAASVADPVIDASVVDLRQAKSLVVDPAVVRSSGYSASFAAFAKDPTVNGSLEKLYAQQLAAQDADDRLRNESHALLLERVREASEKAIKEGRAVRPVESPVVARSGLPPPTPEEQEGIQKVIEIHKRVWPKEEEAVRVAYIEWQRDLALDAEAFRKRSGPASKEEIRAQIRKQNEVLLRRLTVINEKYSKEYQDELDRAGIKPHADTTRKTP